MCDRPKGKYNVTEWEKATCDNMIISLTYFTRTFIAPPKHRHSCPIVGCYWGDDVSGRECEDRKVVYSYIRCRGEGPPDFSRADPHLFLFNCDCCLILFVIHILPMWYIYLMCIFYKNSTISSMRTGTVSGLVNYFLFSLLSIVFDT